MTQEQRNARVEAARVLYAIYAQLCGAHSELQATKDIRADLDFQHVLNNDVSMIVVDDESARDEPTLNRRRYSLTLAPLNAHHSAPRVEYDDDVVVAKKVPTRREIVQQARDEYAEQRAHIASSMSSSVDANAVAVSLTPEQIDELLQIIERHDMILRKLGDVLPFLSLPLDDEQLQELQTYVRASRVAGEAHTALKRVQTKRALRRARRSSWTSQLDESPRTASHSASDDAKERARMMNYRTHAQPDEADAMRECERIQHRRREQLQQNVDDVMLDALTNRDD